MKKPNFSKEYLKYNRKQKLTSISVVTCQILILACLVFFWELLTKLQILDSFIFSSPSRILETLKELIISEELIFHIKTTLNETILGFLIATSLGFLISVFLWWSKFLKKVLDPYIVIFNSLPKVALGPILIIWLGVGTKSIVGMAVLICIIITVITITNAFNSAEKDKILLLKSMGANKFQILFKLIIPGAMPEFISLLKINVGLSWVGTIMGEYLSSNAGLGYLIVYGSQVFKLDLVMTSTVILCSLAGLMYFAVSLIEKLVKKHR